MPGKYLRTASGIQQVKDWYIRVPTLPSSSHSFLAGSSGGSRGFEDTATGGPNYGSCVPSTTGDWQIRGLVWANGSTGNPTIVYIAHQGNTPIPADDDTAFSTISILGVFQDSAGLSVTRTLTRSARSSTNTNVTTGTRQWQFDGALAAQFIDSTLYTVTINRVASGGSGITRVREAYVKTASGIQKYYPAYAVDITAVDWTASSTLASAITADSGYGIGGDGDIFRYTNGTQTDTGDWLTPRAGPAGYSVRATLLGGVISSGTFGSWITLTAGVVTQWHNTRTTAAGLGSTSGAFIVELRDPAGTIVDSAIITLHADHAS